jgi:hypothetical protein
MTDDGRAAVCRSADLQFGTRRALCLKTGAPTSGPACIPAAVPANHTKTHERECRGMPGQRPALRTREFAGEWGGRSAHGSGNGKAVSLFDLIRTTRCQGEWDKLGPRGLCYSVCDLVRNQSGVLPIGAPRRLRGSVRPTIGFRSPCSGESAFVRGT